MKILALIFSFNDADVIEQTIAAISRQTRPVDEIRLSTTLPATVRSSNRLCEA
jgi:hypothetical protein